MRVGSDRVSSIIHQGVRVQATLPRRSLRQGQELGPYQIIKRLATGGMAELYLARRRGLQGFQKTVALKRVLSDYAGEPEFVNMFLDEARLSAGLNHPNIVQVHELGSADGQYFFVMEYVVGLNLRELRDLCKHVRVALPVEHALTIICGAAAGLHYAHEQVDYRGRSQGIIHRDVSPSNVLVSFDGAVKVADFGVAKSADRRSRTEVGLIKGKIGYMSPEQCRNRPLDRRSDVFSLGVLLYELTTGTRLYCGANDFAVLEATVQGKFEPPSRVCAGYPADLEQIVLRALAPEVENRYASARDFSRDLENYARAHGVVLSNASLSDFLRGLCQTERAVEGTEHIEVRDEDWDAVPTMASLIAWLEANSREPAAAVAPAPPPPPPPAPAPAPVVAFASIDTRFSTLEEAPTAPEERSPRHETARITRGSRRFLGIAFGLLVATGLGILLGMQISQQWFELFGRPW